MGRSLWLLSNVKVTSARFKGERPEAPAKMTSSICLERNDRADISPRHQRSASTMLDLPQPLGPTMPETPGLSSRQVLSAKDLNPTISMLFKCIFYLPLSLSNAFCHWLYNPNRHH